MTERTHPVCSPCRSPDVLSDAYAEWDHEAQAWVLQNTFEKGAFCNACDGETSIDWEDGDPEDDEE